MKLETAIEMLTSKLKDKSKQNKNLNCIFIRIDPDEGDFVIFRAINEIFRHIKQPTKKLIKRTSRTINEIFRHIKQSTKKLIKRTSTRLLCLEFNSDNIVKLNALKFIAKKYCLIISNNGNILRHL